VLGEEKVQDISGIVRNQSHKKPKVGKVKGKVVPVLN
jgi:hypothetical protein